MAKKLTTAEILTRFKAAHGDHYDYSRLHYRGMFMPVTIGCPVHGWFVQAPQSHARGSGCQECNFDKIYPRALGF